MLVVDEGGHVMECLSTEIPGEAMGCLMMGNSGFGLPGELLVQQNLLHLGGSHHKLLTSH